MNRPSVNMRPVHSAGVSRRTDRPLFFNGTGTESTDWDLEGYVEIPLMTQLPNLPVIQGETHRELRRVFKRRVSHNEKGLDLAYVNRHDAPHMDRVASGVFHLGNRLGFAPKDVQAATLATRFHDVGYEFPEGADPGELEKLGKDIHAKHAPAGANLVLDALAMLRRRSPAVSRELKDWDDETMQIAHQSIALHSNSVGTDDTAPPLALLSRLVDKIDNTESRVRSSHVEAFRIAPFRSVQHIQQLVRAGQKRVLSEDSVNVQKRHGLTQDEVRDHLHAVDPYYFHRLAPLAIQDQRLFLNPETVAMRMEYQVYPSVVSDALGVEYTEKDHLTDFKAAYTRSMQNAAEVIQTLQRALSRSTEVSGEPLLTVSMNYDDGRRHVLAYNGS